MIYPYKSLFKTALVAIPLLGLPGSLTVYFQANLPSQASLSGLIFNILVMLMLWLINISILKLTERWHKKYLRYVISITLIFLISLILSSILDIHKHTSIPVKSGIFFHVFNSQINNFKVLFIMDLVIFRTREKIARNENAELRIRNLEAQQLQLRQQIQPHFLFNSLNTLKSLISNHPNEAEEYLVKLSSFLRHNLSSNSQDLISLKEELEICSEYLEIQKVRFKEALQYSIEANNQNTLDSPLPIFAIQLLVENAIKHNVLTNESPLKIEITIVEETYISVCNNLQKTKCRETSPLIGLKNLSERYILLGKKEIQIIETHDKYEVRLPLN